MNNFYAKKILLISLILFTSPLFATSNYTNDYSAEYTGYTGYTNETKPALSATPTIRLEVLSDGQLIAGRKISATARLLNISDNTPLADGNLVDIQGHKIHLLLIDANFTDYQHIHPESLTSPYAFNFTFTPKFNSSYRVWAYIIPSSSKKEEILNGWLGSEESSFIDRKISYTTIIDGYNFTLSFDNAPKVNQNSTGKINIVDRDKKPVIWALPTPREFANIIAFYNDNRHIMHIYPNPPTLKEMQAAGSPDIKFNMTPQQDGFIKMFVHVPLGGKEILVPFSFNIEKQY